MAGARTRVRAEVWISDIVEAQRGTLLLWTPLALGVGIGIYFSLRFEPGMLFLGAIGAIGVVAGGLARFFAKLWSLVALAVLLIVFGFLLAAWSAHRVAAPVLSFHYYGAVDGRIVAVDRSNSGFLRLTLDHLILQRTSPGRTPARVRISLRYPKTYVPLEPGRRVILTASLSPLSGPVEPDGFDFQRHAWFRALGAVGYSRTPVLEIAAPDIGGISIWIAHLRQILANHIRAQIPGQSGAFAAAILTGDRSGISQKVLHDLRNSNLAHLLAISGLHMGLLTGFVFGAVRLGLAAIPFVVLRFPVEKIAAFVAFPVATAYLALSGANVSTQRAFIMVSVMLLAIVLGRKAFSLRAVALAAVIILISRPESLIEAGFQMSFAATTALVAVFAYVRDRHWLVPNGSFWQRMAVRLIVLVMSSAIAGLATAPIAAFHFNRVAQYGLLANLASVPLMGVLVMPAAVIATILTPTGLAGIFWAITSAGLKWILFVAATVAALDGAIHHVVKPPMAVLVAIVIGALVLILFRGRGRMVGLLPIVAGFLIWPTVDRPTILVSDTGKLIGIMRPTGRWLSREKGSGFAARSWLENDGDNLDQSVAAARKMPNRDKKSVSLRVAGKRVVLVLDKKISPKDIASLCSKADLLIAPLSKKSGASCPMIAAGDLRKMGAIAVGPVRGKLVITSAQDLRGARLWAR